MRRLSVRSLAFGAIVGCIASLLLVATPAMGRRKEIDYDALDKAWQADDDPREVRSSADEELERLNAMSQADAKAHGPQMMFVTLRTGEPLSEIASRWKKMLWNGGVEVNIYEIESSKVLVGLQKGLLVPELRNFLKEQPEVVEYDWNGSTYTRDDETFRSYESFPRQPTKRVRKQRSKKTKTARARQQGKTIDEL